MLVAIVADTHMPRGRRAIPPRCLELMRGAELILHAGDFVTEEAMSEIEAIGPPVHAVQGNVDSPALRRELPIESVVEVEKTLIGDRSRLGAGTRPARAPSQAFPGGGRCRVRPLAPAVARARRELPDLQSR